MTTDPLDDLLARATPEDLTEALSGLPDNVAASLLREVGGPAIDHLSMLDIAERVLPLYHPRPHSNLLAERLTDALARAEAGEDVRLVVEMPPGGGKSSICSVVLPLYALQRHPDWEVILVSAEASLATKFSRDCRRIVTEGEIPGLYISKESQAVSEWATREGGGMIARGVGGQITGRRARVMVIDDPVKNLADAHSKYQRSLLWDTWQSVLKPRLRPGSLVVLVQTRWHESDLAGEVLKREQWEELNLPALAVGDDPLGRASGEPLLSPQVDETTQEALSRWEKVRAEVGSYVWSAMYQQRPAPPGGQVFKPDWWTYHTPATLPAPGEGVWLSSWDLTFGTGSAESGDYVVGQVWQYHEGTAYLIEQVRGRWEFNDQLAQIRSVAERYPQINQHIVEKAANGAAAVDTLKRELHGVIAIPARGSKEVRAGAVAPMVEAGQVSLPQQAHWLDEFLAEVSGFPSSAAHDDQVDALAQALHRLRGGATGTLHSVSAGAPAPAAAGLSAMRGGFGGG